MSKNPQQEQDRSTEVLGTRQCSVRSVGLGLRLKSLRAVCFTAMNVEPRLEAQEDEVSSTGAKLTGLET